MPLDHYIPQVYLRRFYSKELGKLLYAIRKSDLKMFTPNSESICGINNNSTNKYLMDDRGIESLLKIIEPNYNRVVNELMEINTISSESIYILSGLIAAIQICSPAGMRLSEKMVKNQLETSLKLMDKKGRIPKPPEIMKAQNATELIEKGIITFDIDKKYPQAMGLSTMFDQMKSIGNCRWELLINPFCDNPFFSSDFPIAIEKSSVQGVNNKIFPIDPYLLIKIYPNIYLDKINATLDFSSNQFRARKIGLKEVKYLNKQIVMCAEDLVIYSTCLDWISKYVSKHSQYYIENNISNLGDGNGVLSIYSHEISKRQP